MAKANKDNLYGFYVKLFLVHNNYFPQIRFGQFLSNFADWMEKNDGRDIFYLTEDEFLQYVTDYAIEVHNEGA